LTSIRELPFLERSTSFTFTPFRQTGIGFYDHSDDESATWAVSGFRYPSNQFGNNIGDSGGWAVAGRATLLPVYTDGGDQLVHLGVDYLFTDPSPNAIRFAAQPEIQIAENTGSIIPLPLFSVPPFVNTGIMPTQHTNTFGVEAAGALGQLYLQSEARWAMVKMLDGSTHTFPGAYALARYILTGERLPYNKTGGVFGRIVPDDPFSFSGGGVGAWELAARWSYINLNGANLLGPGRRLNDLTFGVNWYLNKHTKFQFNYIHAFLADPVFGDSNADITAVRAQVDF
jgi:phosphate-selective porin OprO/OprP